jgi:hypothetical protein
MSADSSELSGPVWKSITSNGDIPSPAAGGGASATSDLSLPAISTPTGAALRWYERAFNPLDNDYIWLHRSHETDAVAGDRAQRSTCCDSTDVSLGTTSTLSVSFCRFAAVLARNGPARIRHSHYPFEDAD